MPTDPLSSKNCARIRAYIDSEDFYRYVRAICSKILATLPEEVEDAVLTILVKAWRACKTFNPGPPPPQTEAEWREAFKKWLAQIARNHCTDVLRKHKQDDKGIPPDPGIDPFPDIIDRLAIHACLERLKEEDPWGHELLIGKYWQAKTLEELEKLHNCTEYKVRSGIKRAQDSLSRCLEPKILGEPDLF